MCLSTCLCRITVQCCIHNYLQYLASIGLYNQIFMGTKTKQLDPLSTLTLRLYNCLIMMVLYCTAHLELKYILL